ncbi:hypothetical protein K2173_018552 [Erythroxylum novogranatense]|uniref:Uncharacterized protein n=1 Tax=Erythroxylum novogranatense TaxID=1862640 RepID=A0AAV8UDF1_9ROSI|nr:hypothetical protein K2173_018552 [Erythroxylum novogranatense]
MTEVIQSSPSHFPSPTSSSSPTSCVHGDIPHQQHHPHTFSPAGPVEINQEQLDEDQEQVDGYIERIEREREGDQLSVVELLVAAFRRSIVGCSVIAATGSKELSMEIGLPTNVRHVAHVTFDRFNGFLGLPLEFEPEVPRRAPSASATVFGVSTESMQLSYDSRGNIVPTILLMMQRQLYAQGGLQAEGIFRINAENSQEEYVRDQLNMGVVPEGIDVHCLAGLIKAWFRELPTGVLDSLSPEQVMQSQSEEDCVQLARSLPPTEAALLDWAINLMADVAQREHLNRMNARNVAMVFAPNMTQMSDPLTALMYAVQVMNFLKTLIIRTLRERQDSVIETVSTSSLEPADGNGHQSPSQPFPQKVVAGEESEEEKVFVTEEPTLQSPPPSGDDSTIESDSQNLLTSIQNIHRGNRSLVGNCPGEVLAQLKTIKNEQEGSFKDRSRRIQMKGCKSRNGQSNNSNLKKGPKKPNEQSKVWAAGHIEKNNETGILGRMNQRTQRFDAWR